MMDNGQWPVVELSNTTGFLITLKSRENGPRTAQWSLVAIQSNPMGATVPSTKAALTATNDRAKRKARTNPKTRVIPIPMDMATTSALKAVGDAF